MLNQPSCSTVSVLELEIKGWTLSIIHRKKRRKCHHLNSHGNIEEEEKLGTFYSRREQNREETKTPFKNRRGFKKVLPQTKRNKVEERGKRKYDFMLLKQSKER